MRRLGRLLLLLATMLIIGLIAFFAWRAWTYRNTLILPEHLRSMPHSTMILMEPKQSLTWSIPSGAHSLRIRTSIAIKQGQEARNDLVQSGNYVLHYRLIDSSGRVLHEQDVHRQIAGLGDIHSHSRIIDAHGDYIARAASPLFIDLGTYQRPAAQLELKFSQSSPQIALFGVRVLDERIRSEDDARLRWRRLSESARNRVSGKSVIPRQLLSSEERYLFSLQNLRPLLPNGIEQRDFERLIYFPNTDPATESNNEQTAINGWSFSGQRPMAFIAPKSGTYHLHIEPAATTSTLSANAAAVSLGLNQDGQWQWSSLPLDMHGKSKIELQAAHLYALRSNTDVLLSLHDPEQHSIHFPQGDTQLYVEARRTPLQYRIHRDYQNKFPELRISVRKLNTNETQAKIRYRCLDKQAKPLCEHTLTAPDALNDFERLVRDPFNDVVANELRLPLHLAEGTEHVVIDSPSSAMVRVLSRTNGRWFSMRAENYDVLLHQNRVHGVLVFPQKSVVSRTAKTPALYSSASARMLRAENTPQAQLWWPSSFDNTLSGDDVVHYRSMGSTPELIIAPATSSYVIQRMSNDFLQLQWPGSVRSQPEFVVNKLQKITLRNPGSNTLRYKPLTAASVQWWTVDKQGPAAEFTAFRIANGQSVFWPSPSAKANGKFHVWILPTNAQATINISNQNLGGTITKSLPLKMTTQAISVFNGDSVIVGKPQKLTLVAERSSGLKIQARSSSVYVRVQWEPLR